MTPPDTRAVLHKLVGQWTAKAEEDFRDAGTLLSQEPPSLGGTAFHSQQCAEKYLKAFLTAHQVGFLRAYLSRPAAMGCVSDGQGASALRLQDQGSFSRSTVDAGPAPLSPGVTPRCVRPTEIGVKTHRIKKLLGLVAPIDGGLAEVLADAHKLTPYGVDIRYPADFPAMSVALAKEAFELASKARDSIRAALGEDWLPEG